MAPRQGDARARILDAATTVLTERGIAGATTKEIARAAGYSEANLYKHFTGKEALMAAVFTERLPPLHALLTELADAAASAGAGTGAGAADTTSGASASADPATDPAAGTTGTGTTGTADAAAAAKPAATDTAASTTVAANLERVARRALEFYRASIPVVGALFSDPRLIERHREGLAPGSGPHRPLAELTAYLTAERDRGRLAPGADPRAMADLLMGACMQQAFIATVRGLETSPERDAELAAALVRTLLGPAR